MSKYAQTTATELLRYCRQKGYAFEAESTSHVIDYGVAFNLSIDAVGLLLFYKTRWELDSLSLFVIYGDDDEPIWPVEAHSLA